MLWKENVSVMLFYLLSQNNGKCLLWMAPALSLSLSQ